MNIDDHGDVMLYDLKYHGEITLGSINPDGEFVSSFWLETDEGFVSQLKEMVRELYFGERESYTERSQEEWPDHYKKFMSLNEIDNSVYEKYEKISTEGVSSQKPLGRFQTTEGIALNGIYRLKIETEEKVLLINHGKLCLEYQVPHLSATPAMPFHSPENLKTLDELEWSDDNGQLLLSGQEIFNRVLNGTRPMGEYYLKGKEKVGEQMEQALKRGCKMLVYAHKNEDDKFRVIVFRAEKEMGFCDKNSFTPYVKALLEKWPAEKKTEVEGLCLQAIEKIENTEMPELAKGFASTDADEIKKSFEYMYLNGYPPGYILSQLLT